MTHPARLFDRTFTALLATAIPPSLRCVEGYRLRHSQARPDPCALPSFPCWPFTAADSVRSDGTRTQRAQGTARPIRLCQGQGSGLRLAHWLT